jgi:thioredoxin-dependent peroxiredoxin
MARTATPVIGRTIPEFTAASTAGKDFTLGAAQGKALVLFFYPKDATAGCTVEAQEFRDLHTSFRRAGAQVVGISRDTLKAHAKFRDKEALPFHLLSDPDETLCKLFDVIREKSLYGRKYLGIERSTFLIDDKGVLRHEWRKVKVAGHAQEVLETLRSLD